MEKPVVVLELTIEQAQSVVDALDLYVRMGLGQVMELSHLVRQGVLPTLSGTASIDQCEAIDATLRVLQAQLRFSNGRSLGIGNELTPVAARRAYEVEKVLSKTLAVQREPSPSFKGVHYDGLTVRYTRDPAPVSFIKKDPADPVF